MRSFRFLLLVCCAAAPVQAGSVRLWGQDSFNNLYTVDVATREATLVSTPSVLFWDIAFDAEGNLFGVSNNGSLYTIDPPTGSTTLIGSTGRTTNSLVFGVDGSLWAAGTGALYELDIETGEATLAVDLGPFASAGDLAFDTSGNLVLSTSQRSLIRIDTDLQSYQVMGDLGFFDIFGLARSEDGSMFGITSSNQLLTVNPSTGTSTSLGIITALDFTIGETFGSSFTSEAIPEPATFALLAVGLVAFVGQRRRYS